MRAQTKVPASSPQCAKHALPAPLIKFGCRLEDAGVLNAAHRHRLLYSAAEHMAVRQRAQDAQAARWPLLSLLVVCAAAATTMTVMALLLSLVFSAPARQAALTLGALLASEVRACAD